MKIWADIIKHACNRFNIDPKDLFDDLDSCAQSKSSSRAPAEGDKKENELALNTTKRCGNTLSLYETQTSCKKEKSARISARRDVKSRKDVQGGARGRKWWWRYFWRCFWSVFVIDTSSCSLFSSLLFLSFSFFGALGIFPSVQKRRNRYEIYFCQKGVVSISSLLNARARARERDLQ